MDQFLEAWNQFEGSVAADGKDVSALNLALFALIGGVLSLYVRWLYRRFSASASETDSITRIFPLLVIVTTGVITVVKSSLALSLGLVGALSIVRFRAAIKEPEELTYLFLCIAIGLSLGAELPLLAVALVVVATIFVVLMHRDGRVKRESTLMLTITGDANQYFASENGAAIAAIDDVVKNYSLQRLDIEGGQGQLRISIGRRSPNDATTIINALRSRLPDCDFSYVNLDRTV